MVTVVATLFDPETDRRYDVDAARAHALTCLATERELKEVDICPIAPSSKSPTEAAIETVRR